MATGNTCLFHTYGRSKFMRKAKGTSGTHTQRALIKRNFLPLYSHNTPSPTPLSPVLVPTPLPHPYHSLPGTLMWDTRYLHVHISSLTPEKEEES